MYRVLLADDEPLILSGLQSMLQWEELGCSVAGAVRSGRQALDFIRQYRPDIVICDITMPQMTGLELLEHAAREFPEIVFIMLTNHSQFQMAQEALRYRAIDYLLKIELDEQKLEYSVRQAMEECEKRSKLSGVPSTARATLAEQVTPLLCALVEADEETVARAAAQMESLGVAGRCVLAELVLDPCAIPNIAAFSEEEERRLFDLHRKLADDIAQKLFGQTSYLIYPHRPDRPLIFIWNLRDMELLGRFQSKLASAFTSVSQMQVSLLTSEMAFSGAELKGMRHQLDKLEEAFAASPSALLHYSQVMTRADYVEEAKRYVQEHILGHISVQDAAEKSGITPNYLSSLFKRQLGQNFMDYVNAAKIEYACSLLRKERHRVYAVSHMLGYDNAYYFSKVFKRYTGLSPSEYHSRYAMQNPKEEL